MSEEGKAKWFLGLGRDTKFPVFSSAQLYWDVPTWWYSSLVPALEAFPDPRHVESSWPNCHKVPEPFFPRYLQNKEPPLRDPPTFATRYGRPNLLIHRHIQTTHPHHAAHVFSLPFATFPSYERNDYLSSLHISQRPLHWSSPRRRLSKSPPPWPPRPWNVFKHSNTTKMRIVCHSPSTCLTDFLHPYPPTSYRCYSNYSNYVDCHHYLLHPSTLSYCLAAFAFSASFVTSSGTLTAATLPLQTTTIRGRASSASASRSQAARQVALRCTWKRSKMQLPESLEYFWCFIPTTVSTLSCFFLLEPTQMSANPEVFKTRHFPPGIATARQLEDPVQYHPARPALWRGVWCAFWRDNQSQNNLCHICKEHWRCSVWTNITRMIYSIMNWSATYVQVQNEILVDSTRVLPVATAESLQQSMGTQTPCCPAWLEYVIADQDKLKKTSVFEIFSPATSLQKNGIQHSAI